MGNDGKIPAKDKGSYPRPMGGHEPSAQGVSDNIPNSDRSFNPKGGYDYSSSLEGKSQADLHRGYAQGERINATSDQSDADKAAGAPRA